MTYLSRQIFPYSINWASAVQRTVSFDLRSLLLGFGAEVAQPSQTYTVNGWSFTLTLSGADIAGFESFSNALVGRLNGFWLPCPIEAAQFVAGVSTTQFDVVAEDLVSSWNERPDQHLLLIFPNGTQQAAQISGVATSGANERITLTAALTSIPPAGTIIKRLHYVRFSDDSEQGSFVNENLLNLSLTLIELPTEYANVQTGLQPIYLYHFWTNNPAQYDWRYTSFAAPVVSNNFLYSNFPMTHGSLKSTSTADAQTLELDAIYDASHPFALFMPLPPQRPVNVEIFEVSCADLNTQTRLFTGWISNVDDDGEQLKATCQNWTNIMQQKLPRMFIQPTCNYNVFDGATCKALRAAFETTGIITGISNSAKPPTMVLSLPYTALPQYPNWISLGWFNGGFLETGYGNNFEVRTILFSNGGLTSGTLLLSTNAPLNNAVVGQSVQLVRGCDGLQTTCTNVFNNYANFGGFIAVPTRNLSLKAIDNNVSSGGKKG